LIFSSSQAALLALLGKAGCDSNEIYT